MKKLKLCKDCEWADDRTEMRFKECLCPKQFITSLVTGGKYSEWEYCSIHRGNGFPMDILLRQCGKRARWFEPKKKKGAKHG